MVDRGAVKAPAQEQGGHYKPGKAKSAIGVCAAELG